MNILKSFAFIIKELVPPPPFNSKPVNAPLAFIVTPYLPFIPFMLVALVVILVVLFPTVVLRLVTRVS